MGKINDMVLGHEMYVLELDTYSITKGKIIKLEIPQQLSYETNFNRLVNVGIRFTDGTVHEAKYIQYSRDYLPYENNGKNYIIYNGDISTIPIYELIKPVNRIIRRIKNNVSKKEVLDFFETLKQL